MYAMAIGELLMLIASGVIIRETVHSYKLADMGRSLLAGVVTILVMRLLPALNPFFAIPLCVLVFAGMSLLVGAVKRSDVEMLKASRKRS
jgi:hypothetical protein